MKKSIQTGLVLVSSLISVPAFSTPVVINDGYVGSDSHGHGDVIGHKSIFDIFSVEADLSGTVLNLKINTNFAGEAGVYSGNSAITNGKGIGYGDLLLSSSWNPYGADPYIYDDNQTGTLWSYGLALDNSWSNAGGGATLYQLSGSTNDDNTILSDDLFDCCTFRNGQEVLVDENSSTVTALGNASSWSVNSGANLISMTIDLAGTDLLLGNELAFHWGETCGNDTFEGSMDITPVSAPATLLLLGGGLIGLAATRRKKHVA